MTTRAPLTTTQLAQYCADHFPIQIGYTFKQSLIAAGIALVVGAAVAWYVKGRGMAGVKIDLNNVKTDVENIKSKIFPSTPAVAAATPVV